MSRWEFFSTLDYEWNVFRGHIPYRWTIWVRDYQCLTLVPSPMWIDFSDSTDLFSHTHSWSHECDISYDWLGFGDSDQLSGGCHVAFVPICGFNYHDFKVEISFLVVSESSNCCLSPRENACIWIQPHLVLLLPGSGRCFTASRSSHVCSALYLYSIVVFSKQCSSRLLVLQFGTEIRLLSWWLSACGGSTLYFLQKVGSFPSSLLQAI